MKQNRNGLKFVLFFLILLIANTSLSADRIFEHEIGYLLGTRDFNETLPPVGPVRPVAEFEPASHVIVRYPLGIPLALVTHLSNTAQVITIVSSSTVQGQAQSAFSSAGVNMANVSYIVAPTNSYWTRDFSPWFIVDGNDQFSVVDFRYNRPRPSDDAFPSAFATAMNFPYYGMPLYQTGGNFMTDGINTAAQTQIVYEENTQLSQAAVRQKMQAYMGVSNLFVINDPNNTYIDHIDCWGKFLAPDKVLIRSVPTSHSQYGEIEAVANFFATSTNAWGYPYRVYRVYTPQNQPYTNSLILNRKVFVPIMNNTNDAAALQVYRNAMPGYEVIGVTGTSSAPWESTDALHCRTHEVPDRGMLYLEHLPYRGEQNADNPLSFNVKIKAYSGEALYSDSLFVSFRVNQGEWQRSYLTEFSQGQYTTMINSFAPGDTIRYFVHAADQSGRSMDHPYFAAGDPHIFFLSGDVSAPSISHSPISSITNQDEPLMFSAIVSDNASVVEVVLECRIDNGSIQSYYMEAVGNDMWMTYYNTNFSLDNSIFSYRIRATDNSNPPNSATYPSEDQWISVPIIVTGNSDNSLVSIPSGISALYPNPFSNSRHNRIAIDYKAVHATKAELSIYNIKGQLMRQLILETKADGLNRVYVDAKDGKSNILGPGLYIVQLNDGRTVSSKKLIIGK